MNENITKMNITILLHTFPLEKMHCFFAILHVSVRLPLNDNDCEQKSKQSLLHRELLVLIVCSSHVQVFSIAPTIICSTFQ